MFTIVSQAEQSRFSYTIQTEEFRSLNSNLQAYLNDIKRIDEKNRQLQENINQIRQDYIRTLENHLKCLPEDFRQESQVLTEAHLERYKSKSRAKRFVYEREELKKRISFLGTNEKEQIKTINNLQKQERKLGNNLRILNEQIQNLYQYVQTEKQTHQQAMDKVDNLQIQLEQVCIERSKTEFEIQTLREEVKLMQTTKEFLDEEHQTILETQTEANEYFLSRLNDSISRIREDFHELNQSQLKQIENEYKQMMKMLEENTLANETVDEETINQQRTMQTDYEKLQDEHQSVVQELTSLNDHNQILSERVLAMEADLYSIRNERMNELTDKEIEFEQNQIELQTLYDKLNHLAEYDRNLKFELTLYRGVLESEYRRKQQQSSNNNQQLVRPNTLRTITSRSNKNSSKNLNNRNQLEPVIEKNDSQLDEIVSTINHSDEEDIENKEEINRGAIDIPVYEDEEQMGTETTKYSLPIVPENQLSPTMSPANEEALFTSSTPPPDLSSSLEDPQISSKNENVLISSTDPTVPEDQLASSDVRQSPTAPSEIQNIPESTSTNEGTLLGNESPVSSEDRATLSENQDSSITTPVVSEDQQPSSAHIEDRQESSDVQQLSHISPDEQPTLLESSSTPSQEDRSIPSDLQQKVSTPTQEQPSSVTADEHQTRDTDDENQLTEVSDNVVDDQTQSGELSIAENESVLESDQSTTEELISSSAPNQTEEENKIDYPSSAGYYGTINDSSHKINLELSIELLTDAEGDNTDLTEEAASTDIQSNFEAVIQELRYVYRTLLNNDDLVEINDDFPDNLIDRLEFGDNFIRTLFNDLLRKYIVQPVKTEYRSKTLDWMEFRDILFPILTSRYTENHLRKLIDLFDINQTGSLSREELTELLELLQVKNSNELVEKMTKEKDKLNIDELIEEIKRIDSINANLLSEDIESKQWYIQHPTNDETQSISFEVPLPHSPSKTINSIILLSRIFKRVGADVENKQLDSFKPALSMKLTNEFIHNNISVSNDDLQLFIELYLNKKQSSDYWINWTEFRDVFLPLVNGGMVSADDIARWFDILDTNHQEILSSEQILYLLRLLHVFNPQNILNKIQEILPENNHSFTLPDLISALETMDETTPRLLAATEHITSFDLEWLKRNPF